MSRVLSLAGFQVTLIGRFWVTPEAQSSPGTHSDIEYSSRRLGISPLQHEAARNPRARVSGDGRVFRGRQDLGTRVNSSLGCRGDQRELQHLRVEVEHTLQGADRR